MSKSAISFAVYAPDSESLLIVDEFIQIFRKLFREEDIYIGINPCNKQQDVISLFEKERDLGLNIPSIAVTKKRLVVPSDTSAHQTNLYKIKKSEQQYQNIWFLHTKAVTSKVHSFRYMFYHELLYCKGEVLRHLYSYPHFGSYGPRLAQLSSTRDDASQLAKFPSPVAYTLDQYTDSLPYEPLEFFYAHNMYVVKGHIVHKFLDMVNTNFWNAPLATANEPSGDPYFIERDFPRMIDRQGYIMTYHRPYTQIWDNRWARTSEKTAEREHRYELSKWLERNRPELLAHEDRIFNSIIFKEIRYSRQYEDNRIHTII
jgi:hypothetical protein